jgi:hypothetical protein
VTWTLADSPVVVVGGIDVTADARLKIEPGVTVLFDEGTILQVSKQAVSIRVVFRCKCRLPEHF